MFNLEKAITQWLRRFQKHQAYDEGNIREMELHIRDQIEDHLARGMDERSAFEKATESFGNIDEVATEEAWNINREPSIRRFLFRTMINNYFKTSFRGMLKNPISSFINVIGLAVAIGMCLVVYVFYSWDYSLDQFHEHKNEVFLTTFFVNREGTEEQYGISPLPLGEMLQQDFPQVEEMCRIIDGGAIVKYKEHVFEETLRYVDPSFLKVFTFPLKWGRSNSLEDPNSIILSEPMAIKYFGGENPVGEQLLVKFSDTNSKTFTITGVAKPFPEAHIISFDFLINFQNLKTSRTNVDHSDWQEMAHAMLIKVKDPQDLSTVQAGMDKYRKIQNEVEQDWAISGFEFISIADLHFRAGDIRNSISADYNGEARLGMPVIALFMIVMASLNYINIAITSAAKRLKEIGLRKVIGANKRLVVFQFLTENIFMTFLALVVGVILSIILFIPWMKRLSGDPLQFDPLDPFVWFFLLIVLLITGVSSGIYPAVYISKFQPVQIFKGKARFGQKNTATKVFLSLQLVITCAGITNAIIFTQNNKFQNERGWGYQHEGVIYTFVPSQRAYDQLQNAMRQESGVQSLEGSSHHLGASTANQVVHYQELEYEVESLSVGKGYFETMQLELAEGQVFKSDEAWDEIVVNETFVDNLVLKDPIGKQVKINGRNVRIIGVVEDFHTKSFSYEIRPTLFSLAEREKYRFLAVRAHEGQVEKVYQSMKRHWATLFPEDPFNGSYQEDVWGYFFEQLNSAQKFYRAIAFFTVLLAGMGLYGLINLNVQGRIKEFSIRKVLGADLSNLTINLGRQYLVLLIVSFAIGIPFSYMMGKASMEMLYEYPMPMSIAGILIATFFLLLVVGVVILSQLRKLSQADPIVGLKTE